MRCSPKSIARRLAPPLFLQAASSYHEVLTVTQLDKTGAAWAEADAARLDEESFHFLCRYCANICGWSGGEGRDTSSALGSDEAGDEDIDKATRAAIARAYEVDRSDGGCESGAREGGEGGGEGEGVGGWLSGLLAAAPEVPTDVKSGSR
jgi:hypothetical protein